MQICTRVGSVELECEIRNSIMFYDRLASLTIEAPF